MSLREISGSLVWMPEGLKSGLSVYIDSASGVIDSIRESTEAAEFFPGIISPGFINAHCHLELSSLKGKIPKHTGMAGFIKALQTIRAQPSDPEQERKDCVRAAQEMFLSGIQAVADISNANLTAELKQKQDPKLPIFYTFLEVFGLSPQKADALVQEGLEKIDSFSPGQCSLTWHAPYSSSPPLIKAIGEYAQSKHAPFSIHLLESAEEVELFQSRTGPLANLFQEWGISPLPDWFGHSDVLDFLLPLLPGNLKMLWVHGVFLNTANIQRLLAHSPQSAFCLCPAANQYIHNTLPPVMDLLPWSDKILLGTDSLAGNDALNLLDDLKIISEKFPEVPTEKILGWATLNGATFMGWDELGSFAPGKKPGIIQLGNLKGDRIHADTFIHRIL